MPAEDAYSYENISQIRQKERGRTLSKLPFDFYEMFSKRLEKLKDDYQKEYQKDPTTLRSMMRADEVRKTKLIFDEIFRRRKRKIVLAALGNIVDDSQAPSELLPLERQLYDDLILVLKRNSRELDKIFGNEVETEVEIDIDAPIETEIKVPALEPEEKEEAPREPKQKKIEDGPTALIRVLDDLGSFMGPDQRSYTLRKEDVLEVPVSIAEILKQNNKAEVYSS